jgi:hypothetical protein
MIDNLNFTSKIENFLIKYQQDCYSYKRNQLTKKFMNFCKKEFLFDRQIIFVNSSVHFNPQHYWKIFLSNTNKIVIVINGNQLTKS